MTSPDPDPAHASPADAAGVGDRDASATHAPSAWRRPAAVVWFLGVIAVVLAGDLGLKYWAFANVANEPVVVTELAHIHHEAFWRQYPHEPIVVVPQVLSLRLTTNTGAVFGLGKGGRVFFIAVSVLATAIISFMFIRSRANAYLLHLALALILAGALGNLYDRLVYGAVRDMFHLLPETNLWPWIFNLADAALMTGVGLVLMLTFLNERRAKQRSKRTPGPADRTGRD
jgi:signal peptidase II